VSYDVSFDLVHRSSRKVPCFRLYFFASFCQKLKNFNELNGPLLLSYFVL
jgi:hypothetical protein